MRNKFFYILILVFSFGLSNISAQTPTPTPSKILTIQGDVSREAKPADSSSTVPKSISGGVLNGKASSLPKPQYPAAARAVNASGAVNVQVTIDEEGNVISASAVSGHPLLRQAAEQAAQASKFLPTKLQGQPVRVTGVIVYNFVAAMTVTGIGYELSLAEKTQSLEKSQISSISGALPPDWEEERAALKKLDSNLTEKNQKGRSPQTSAPANVNTDKPNPPNGNFHGSVRTVAGIATVNENYSLNDASIAIVRELQSKFESRLSGNEKFLWSFRLGQTLGKLKAEIDSDEKTRVNLLELNQLGANMPLGVSESTLAKVKELIESSQQTTSAAERTEKLLPLIESLRNVRAN